MNQLAEASRLLEDFRAGSLRTSVAKIERKLVGVTGVDASAHVGEIGVGLELLTAALLIIKHSKQINEIVHAIGILLALPYLLESGEVVESLSLAAGNTGKGFDLETNRRIAEFTFIGWQGGPEVVRQNKIFKDFFFLAEATTEKERELFVVGLDHPTKFFESKRSLPQILRGNDKLGKAFTAKYGTSLKVVKDYFVPRKHLVAVRDLTEFLPIFAG
jgi:hypothetical protein